MTLPSFTTVQNALTSWVKVGTGLSTVIWGQQEGGRPAGQFAELRLMGLRSIGLDWRDQEDVVGGPPGADLKTYHRGPREARLRVQCFAGAGVGDQAPAGRLLSLVASANFESQIIALDAARIGILQCGEVQSVDGTLGSSFEARAMVEIRLSLLSEIEELGTYIQAVEAEGEDPVLPPFWIGTKPTLLPPTGLAATPGNTQITLTWTNAVGAHQYKVYRGLAPGVTPGTGTLVSSTAQTPFVNNGLTNGITYYYVVVSTNPSLPDSAASLEVSATPSP